VSEIMEKYRFCPYCSGKVETRYVESEGAKRTICSACRKVFYYNSAPCVGALIVDRDKILLVKRATPPYKGYWDIPGGFLEAGEHPKDGVIREVLEETGLRVRPLEILGIFMDKYGAESRDTLNIHYIVEIIGGEAQPGSDAGTLKWFSKNNLPEKIAFRNGREALRVWQSKNSQCSA